MNQTDHAGMVLEMDLGSTPALQWERLVSADSSLSTKGAMCTQLVELPPALPANTSETES